jgi:hypothetical protein
MFRVRRKTETSITWKNKLIPILFDEENHIDFGGNIMATVNIPDELKTKIQKAVKNGACCSVDHWVEKTIKAALK